jgi:hypothetical protein
MTLRTDPARRPSFDLHIPGGETYFGGWFSILAVDDAVTNISKVQNRKMRRLLSRNKPHDESGGAPPLASACFKRSVMLQKAWLQSNTSPAANGTAES